MQMDKRKTKKFIFPKNNNRCQRNSAGLLLKSKIATVDFALIPGLYTAEITKTLFAVQLDP
jgi:hypothetical protein